MLEGIKKQALKVMAVIAAIACAAALPCALTACGEDTPAKAAESFLKGIQKGDVKTAQETPGGVVSLDYLIANAMTYGYNPQLDESGNPAPQVALPSLDQNAITTLANKLKGFKFEVVGEQVNDISAVVDVSIATCNAAALVEGLVPLYAQEGIAAGAAVMGMSTTEVLNQIENLPMTYEVVVPLTLTKRDGKWEVDSMADQPALSNALTGGLLGAFTMIRDMGNPDARGPEYESTLEGYLEDGGFASEVID